MVAAGVVVIATLVVLVIKYKRPTVVSTEFGLTVWGLENKVIFEKIIENYKTIRPGANITYRQVNKTNYKNLLLNALAAGTGPDIFEITNHELPRQKSKLVPVPSSQFDIIKLRDLFPYAIEQDFVSASGSQIYALPMYLDTLALIYNKSFFDNASIVYPPKIWDEFLKIVPRLRTIGSSRQLTRAAAAIGGSEKSIGTATDILELLMMQNGASMTTAGNSAAAFASFKNGETNPGFAAFNFYLQFANVASPYYTWNDSQTKSVDSFVNGKTAMIFDYMSTAAAIKRRSPFLDFAVAPMLQPKGADVSINFPKYAGFAVSKQSKVPGWAWDFVIYAATNADAAKVYLDGTGYPPALRSLIAARMDDLDFGIFAKQALTARSWYEADDEKIDGIMNGAIEDVLLGKSGSEQALSRAQDQITALMGARR